MQIGPNDRGRLHVFAVNRLKQDIEVAFTETETGADQLNPDPILLEQLTGTDALEPRGAELIDIAALEGIGLSGFLAEGHEIAVDALAPARAKLDALDGYALILRSQAFQGQSVSLATSDLIHIASFDEPGTDWSSSGAIPSEAAKPHSAPPRSPREERARTQRLGGAIFAGFMLAIALFVWWLVT